MTWSDCDVRWLRRLCFLLFQADFDRSWTKPICNHQRSAHEASVGLRCLCECWSTSGLTWVEEYVRSKCLFMQHGQMKHGPCAVCRKASGFGFLNYHVSVLWVSSTTSNVDLARLCCITLWFWLGKSAEELEFVTEIRERSWFFFFFNEKNRWKFQALATHQSKYLMVPKPHPC